MESLQIFEIHIIHFLQNFRNSFLDCFFYFINFFDTRYFSLILIPIIFVGYDWKWGVRLYYLITINFFINSFLKYVFAFPRPFYIDSSLFVLDVKGYGFPSGAAQMSLLYAGLFFKNSKNKKLAGIFSIIFLFLIGFSKVYLGIHFIYDIIGGWIFGFFVIWLFFYSCPKIEDFIVSMKLIGRFLFSWIFPIFLLFFLKYPHVKEICIASFSISTGLCLSVCFGCILKKCEKFLERVFRIGVFGFFLFLIHLFIKDLFLKVFIEGISLTFFIPFFWKNFFFKFKNFR